MAFEEFKTNVEQWAEARGIYEHSTVRAQLLKSVSELGEVADAIIKGDREALKDGIGDVVVCQVNAAKMAGYELSEVADDIKQVYEKSVVRSIPKSEVEDFTVGTCLNCIGVWLTKPNAGAADSFYAPIYAMIALALAHDLDFMDCCQHAWNQIKDRKGKMVAGGAFVKEAE